VTTVIAVDGPGGSGKSTVSRAVAERLGWAHLDTGAFYRAATVVTLERGIDPTDGDAILAELVGTPFDQVDGRMVIDGRDVSDVIRSEPVTAAVSAVSAHPGVRAEMVARQRRWVEGRAGVVVEGRDIGTVVFPHAEVKVFLTADPSERARRRAGETGGDAGVVAAALARRDRLDSSRDVSPLQAATDAVMIDTTELSIDEVVGAVIELVVSG
jgi:cytidylate kinase